MTDTTPTPNDDNSEETVIDKRTVTPIKGGHRERDIVTCDIETYDDEDGRKQMVYGAVYNGHKFWRFEDAGEMRDFLLNATALRSSWVFAHNGEFDFGILGVIDELERVEGVSARVENQEGHSALVVKDGGFRFATQTRFRLDEVKQKEAKHMVQRLTSDPDETLTGEQERAYYENARVDKRRRVFLDSMQFTLGSLKSSAEMMDVERKGDFDYSKITEKNEMQANGHWQDMVDYCDRDCKVLHQVMTKYQDMVNELGATLQVTTASTSLDLFRREYLTQPYHQQEDHMGLCEQARFGGLTQAMVSHINHGGHSTADYDNGTVVKIDINSSYPFQMTRGIPSGNQMVRKENEWATVDNIQEWEGVSKVTITVPADEEIPILPYQPGDRLHFPTGKISGAWTHAELRYALERDYEIHEVHEQLLATDTLDELGDFAKDLYEGRQDVRDENPALGGVMKIQMNSQYGKWCQKDIPQWEQHDPFAEQGGDVENAAKKVDHTITPDGHVEATEKIKTGEMKVANNHPIVGGYITAYGRLQLIRAMHRTLDAGGKPLYCDTDSIVIADLTPDEIKNVVDLGDGLGKWDVEAGEGHTKKVVVDQEQTGANPSDVKNIKEERTTQEYEVRVLREKAYQERYEMKQLCPMPKTTLKGVPGQVRHRAFDQGSTGTFEKFAGHQESKKREDVEPLQTIEMEKNIKAKSSSKRVLTDDYSRAKTAEEVREDLD